MQPITYTVHVTQDDTPVRGNALVSGNVAADKEAEDEILARLDRGDVWAWACVEVRAHRGDLYGSAYLGACCYKNEADFVKDAYYTDLCAEALDDLKKKSAPRKAPAEDAILAFVRTYRQEPTSTTSLHVLAAYERCLRLVIEADSATREEAEERCRAHGVAL